MKNSTSCRIIMLYHCYEKRSFLYSPFCILHQLPCVTGRVPRIGDEIVYMIHNMAVCSHDCDLARDAFHPRWIEGAVKSIWRWDGPLRRMVWQQQSELHFWVEMLRSLNCWRCKAVKSTIVTDDKFFDTIFNNVLLHSRIQYRINFFRCLAVSDEKTAFPLKVFSPL